MCFLTIIHFKFSVTKDFFLMLIKKKKKVFGERQIPTSAKVKKMCSKKHPE